MISLSDNFRSLRERGALLSDPSALWCELAASREKFLFIRPPRFGKTTLVSGLASLFARGTEDFRGLAAQRLWREPLCDVVVLDFADAVRPQPASAFDEALAALLVRGFAPHGFTFSGGDVLDSLSAWLSKRPSNSLALLIDNFDAPLAAFSNDTAVRNRLSSFYAMLKSREGCLRFFLMTGAASFESGRLFTTFNITTNISYFPRFAALTGLTGAALREAIAARSLAEGAAIESAAQALEAQFGRSSFDLHASVPLCAPEPVRRFLEAPQEGLPPADPLPPHWIERLSRLPADALTASLEEQLLPLALLTSPAPDASPVVVLLQSGLLTLRRRLRNTFLVGCANDSARKQLAQLPRELRQKANVD